MAAAAALPNRRKSNVSRFAGAVSNPVPCVANRDKVRSGRDGLHFLEERLRRVVLRADKAGLSIPGSQLSELSRQCRDPALPQAKTALPNYFTGSKKLLCTNRPSDV
jgi:hypothetical protein